MSCHQTDLVEAIHEKLGTAPEYLTPGKMTRFGKTKNCWAYLFEDGTGCVFGDWSTRERHDWQAGTGAATNIFKANAIVTNQLSKRIADVDYYWDLASMAGDGCQYFKDKGTKKPDGLRWRNGAILVPMRTIDGLLVGILRIYPDGAKRIVSGSNPTGAFFQIGDILDLVYIVEGLATGATIHSITSTATIVAFTNTNLTTVASAIHQHYPNIQIVICADDDHSKESNPGLSEAKKAACAVKGLIAAPAFPRGDRCPSDTDFNDLCRIEGEAAVLRCLAAAVKVHNV